MDLLRSWLYGREKPDRFSSHFNKPSEISSPMTREADGSKTIIRKGQHTENNYQNLNTTDHEPSKLEKLMLKVVPLEPGDCLGCKIVGTSVMIASGIIVLTSAMAGRKRNPNLIGRKLTTYYAVCGSLFIGFEAAAFCRFFDVGPFGYLARLQPQDTNR